MPNNEAAWMDVGLGDGCRDARPFEAYDSVAEVRLDPASGQGSIPCAAAQRCSCIDT